MFYLGIKKNYIEGLSPLGYTNYSEIFVSEELWGEYEELVSLHEAAHILLKHKTRTLALKHKYKKVDYRLSNVAADLEIAKKIYDNYDNQLIERPRSILAGGISIKHCNEYPDCETMEEYYDAIINDPENKFMSMDDENAIHLQISIENSDENAEPMTEQQIKDLTEEVQGIIKELVEKRNESKSLQKLEKKVLDFKHPKPSLASEIDAALGRFKIKKERSYARINRRSNDSGLFTKGSKNKRKKPKLMVYVDRSGSFSLDKTSVSQEKISEIIKKYRCSIDMDIVYFNNDLIKDDPKEGSGGTNYQCVLTDIEFQEPELAIIITDSDHSSVEQMTKDINIIVLPVGCSQTWLATQIKCKEVTND